MIRNLKIAAIINIITSVFYFFIGGFLPFTILLASGVFILDLINKGTRKIKANEQLLLIIGILTVVINPISAIFLFLGLSMKNEKIKKPKVKKIDPEIKKLDIILKLGVSIVLLAGFLFTTTSWHILTDIYKLFGLLLLSLIFYSLYWISETKTKLLKTSFSYWNISMAFLVFALVSIGLFKTFGNYFSFDAAGHDLVYFSIFSLLAIISYFSNLKFKFAGYKYLFCVSILLALNSLLLHINLLIYLHFLVFTMIVFALNYYKIKDIHYQNFIEILTIFIMPLLYIFYAWQLSLAFNFYFLLAILTIGNALYFTFKTNNKHYANYLTPAMALLLIYVSLLVLKGLNINTFTPLLTGIYALLFVISVLIHYKEILYKNFLVFTNVTFIFIYLSLFDRYCDLRCLTVTIMILLTSIFYFIFDKKKDFLIEKYAQPIKISGFAIALYLIIAKLSIYLEASYFIHFLYFLMILLMLFSKTNFFKQLYYIYFNVIFVIALIMSFWQSNVVTWFLIFGSFLMFAYVYLEKIKHKDKFALISYYIFLITLFLQFVLNNILGIGDMAASLLVIAIYVTLYYQFKNKDFRVITLLLGFIPIVTFLNSLLEPSVSNLIATRSVYFVGIYMFNRLILEKNANKALITAILVVGTLLSIIFVASPYIGMYVGIIALLLMYIGFVKERYVCLFYIGVITTLVNIMFQLKDIWEKIPFWLYLLVLGLTMILFVTKKELTKK